MDQMEKRLGADKSRPKSSAAASRVHCPRWIMQLDKPGESPEQTTDNKRKERSNQNNNQNESVKQKEIQ